MSGTTYSRAKLLGSQKLYFCLCIDPAPLLCAKHFTGSERASALHLTSPFPIPYQALSLAASGTSAPCCWASHLLSARPNHSSPALITAIRYPSLSVSSLALYLPSRLTFGIRVCCRFRICLSGSLKAPDLRSRFFVLFNWVWFSSTVQRFPMV